MLTYKLATTLVAAMGFMASGTAMALMLDPAPMTIQPIATSAEVSTVVLINQPSVIYPAGVTWMDMLKADPVLYALARAESAGTFDPFIENPHDAAITGYVSTGIFQYQPGTFRGFVKEYDAMPGATDEEIDAAITDPYIQIYITRRALIDGRWNHWYNSYTILNLPKDYIPTWTSTPSGLVSKRLD